MLLPRAAKQGIINMSNKEHHSHGERDYADKDIRVRPLFLFIMLALGVTFLTFFGIRAMIHSFNREAIAEAQFDNVHSTDRQLPSGVPMLQPALQAAVDLKKLRAEEDALLHSTEWVNKDEGIVRIPIDQAMERVVEAGFPVREGAAAKP